MTQADRDDLLLALYVQVSRIYDLLLVGPDADRQQIQELHAKGELIGPAPLIADTRPEETE